MPLLRHLGNAPYVTWATPRHTAFPSSTNITIAQLNKYILAVHYFYLGSMSIPRDHSSFPLATELSQQPLFAGGCWSPDKPTPAFPKGCPSSLLLRVVIRKGRQENIYSWSGQHIFCPIFNCLHFFPSIILSFQTSHYTHFKTVLEAHQNRTWLLCMIFPYSNSEPT